MLSNVGGTVSKETQTLGEALTYKEEQLKIP